MKQIKGRLILEQCWYRVSSICHVSQHMKAIQWALMYWMLIRIYLTCTSLAGRKWVPRDRKIHIKMKEKETVRKGNSHIQEEERNVASIKYGSLGVLFLWNIHCVTHAPFKGNFLWESYWIYFLARVNAIEALQTATFSLYDQRKDRTTWPIINILQV